MRNRLRKLLTSLPLVKSGDSEDGELRLEARVPGLGRQPFLSVQARLQTEAADDGERTRLQARVEARFGALSLRADERSDERQALPGASAVCTSGSSSPLRYSATARPLHRGAGSLFPAKLAEVGAVRAADGPPLQAWMAELPGGTGVAQVTTLALDTEDLPESARRRLRGRPFHLAATLVQTAEEDFS